MASVRGIGVAVITSWCGTWLPDSPLSRSARRWCTPKRCCSSTIASASEAKATLSCISACVPTTTWARPLAISSRAAARALPVTLPASQATRRPRGSSQARKLPRCCSASSSVGAISATWRPASTALAAASAATTVLPLPTSPCTRRSIGSGRAMSLLTSSSTRCWAPVSLKARRWRRALASLPGGRTGIAPWARRAMRCRRRLRWWASSSSSASRRWAGCRPAANRARSASGGGRCAVSRASRSVGRARRSRMPAGSSSSAAASGRRLSASPTSRATDCGPRPSIAGYTGSSESRAMASASSARSR